MWDHEGLRKGPVTPARWKCLAGTTYNLWFTQTQVIGLNTRVTEWNLMVCDIQEMNLDDLMVPISPKALWKEKKKWKNLQFWINFFYLEEYQFFVLIVTVIFSTYSVLECVFKAAFKCKLLKCLCVYVFVCLHACAPLEVPDLQVNRDIRFNAQHLILFQRLISSDFKVDQTFAVLLVQMRYGVSSMQLYKYCECYKTSVQHWITNITSQIKYEQIYMIHTSCISFQFMYTGGWGSLCTHIFVPLCDKNASCTPRWQLERWTCVPNKDLERARRQTDVCLLIFVKKHKPRNLSEKTWGPNYVARDFSCVQRKCKPSKHAWYWVHSINKIGIEEHL